MKSKPLGSNDQTRKIMMALSSNFGHLKLGRIIILRNATVQIPKSSFYNFTWRITKQFIPVGKHIFGTHRYPVKYAKCLKSRGSAFVRVLLKKVFDTITSGLLR